MKRVYNIGITHIDIWYFDSWNPCSFHYEFNEERLLVQEGLKWTAYGEFFVWDYNGTCGLGHGNHNEIQ